STKTAAPSSAPASASLDSRSLGTPDAIAIIGPLGDTLVHGTVRFTEESKGLRVRGQIEGLQPGPHGFHVHEKGDCSAPDGTAAGGHFNPGKSSHGGPGSGQHHAGDFGNIEANSQGVATVNTVFSGLSLRGENGVLGRSIVVHANP